MQNAIRMTIFIIRLSCCHPIDDTLIFCFLLLQDVETLTSLLQNLKSKTLINESTFNHADFFIGNKAVMSLNPKLEEILESVSGNGRTSEVTKDENTISCEGTNVNLVEKSPSTNVSGNDSTDDASSMKTIDNCKSIRQNKNNSDL